MSGATAIGIRICRGGPSVPFTDGPPDSRPSVRPSFPPPSPTRHSNRESRRSDIHPTHANQSNLHRSNRENNAPSRLTINPPASSFLRRLKRLVRARFQPCRNRHRISPASAAEGMFLPLRTTRRPKFAAPTSNPHPQIPNFQLQKKPKNTKNHPPSLFRLERTPTLYFQQLTRNLNEPMFCLERQKAAEKTAAKSPKIHSLRNKLANLIGQQYNAPNDPKQKNNACPPHNAETKTGPEIRPATAKKTNTQQRISSSNRESRLRSPRPPRHDPQNPGPRVESLRTITGPAGIRRRKYLHPPTAPNRPSPGHASGIINLRRPRAASRTHTHHRISSRPAPRRINASQRFTPAGI